MSELLKEWQDRLFLQNWKIVLRDNCKPDDMMRKESWGDCDVDEVNEAALIEIADPTCFVEKILPFDYEKVLVHELLHIKFTLLDGYDNDLQNRYVHVLIDEMARALVDAKRSGQKKEE